MKAFYEKYKRQVNDLFHIVIGFSAMYDIGFLTKFFTYTTSAKIIGTNLLSLVLGAFFGYVWELLNWFFKGSKSDNKDVLRTMLGFALGGLFSTWTEPSQTLFIVLSVLSAAILTFIFTYKK